MKKLSYILAVLVVAVLALSGCGHSDSFVIKGKITTGASMNLRILYYTDGRIVTGITASRDGDFAFEGSAPTLAMVELYDNEYRLLGRTVVTNGQDIELMLTPGDLSKFTAKGNDIAERWSSLINRFTSLSNTDRRNAVADYVVNNTTDPLSSLLIVTEIDGHGDGASLADSLYQLIDPLSRLPEITAGFAALNARVTSATSHAPVTAVPYLAPGGRREVIVPARAPLTLISISDRATRGDSVKNLINSLPSHSKHISAYDLSIDPDTIEWSRSMRADTATWQRGWVAGALSGIALDRLGIPSTPFFIITDSTGTQLLRTTSATAARNYLQPHLK